LTHKTFLSRFSIFFFAMVISSILFPQSSNAIFGLSRCEKAWEQIEAREGTVTYIESRYGQGREFTVKVGSFVEQTFDVVFISLKDIWKIGTNNPKCLSNTQRIVIKEMGKASFANSVLRVTSWKLTKDLKFYTAKTYKIGHYSKLATQ